MACTVIRCTYPAVLTEDLLERDDARSEGARDVRNKRLEGAEELLVVFELLNQGIVERRVCQQREQLVRWKQVAQYIANGLDLNEPTGLVHLKVKGNAYSVCYGTTDEDFVKANRSRGRYKKVR